MSTDRVNLTINFWPVGTQYHWMVPRPDDGVYPIHQSPDIGTAAKESHALATQLYGVRLGNVNFRLNAGV